MLYFQLPIPNYTITSNVFCCLQEEKKELEQDGVPDDEGWIKVTRRGRNPGASRVEAKELQLKVKERKKRKKQVQCSSSFGVYFGALAHYCVSHLTLFAGAVERLFISSQRIEARK